ncbi:MAG: hypothetical protein V7637_3073 [Mycobacteriales bacterium]|jgi:hypothetical protein
MTARPGGLLRSAPRSLGLPAMLTAMLNAMLTAEAV